MRIAIINTVYSSSKSTGKLAYGLYDYLMSNGNNDVYFYYGREIAKNENLHSDSHIKRIGNNFDNYVHGAMSRLVGNQGQYSIQATKKLVQDLKDKNIDAIYLMNLHGYYINIPILFDYIKENSIKCIYVMYDEYAFTGKCCFSFECNKFMTTCKECKHLPEYPKSLFFDKSRHLFEMKRKAYESVQNIVFVGVPYTIRKARQSELLKNYKLVEMDEAINLRDIYYPRAERDKKALLSNLGIPENKVIILTVCSYPNERKGGKYYLECARKVQIDDFAFIHVGFNGDVSECPSNYFPINYVQDQNVLAQYYSVADLFVCTSLAETVADTCLESLACGTPILGFKAAGMPDCADNKHGTFVEAKNSDELVRVVIDTKKKTDEIIQSCREYACSRYDYNEYFSKLSGLLHEFE